MPLQLDLSPLCERFVHVDVLTFESRGIECEINSISEQVVEVDGSQGVLVSGQPLLETCFQASVGFRFQVGICNDPEPADAERFLEAWLFDALSVAASQAESSKHSPTVPEQVADAEFRNATIAEALIMLIADSRDDRRPMPGQDLLTKQRVIAQQAVTQRRCRHIAHKPVFVFEAISE